MRELFEDVAEVLGTGPLQSIGKALIVVLLGLLVAKLVNRRLREGTLQSQSRLLVRRFLTGFILVVTIAWALSLAGVDVSVLLGTAGFLTIAVGFGDSAVNLQFSVWAKRESFLDLRNTIAEDVKRAFDKAGIEIPFPHRTLYAGSATGPLPVRVITDASRT